MRIAVLSDVHSNLEALEAVLDVARAEDARATFVLGDIVGYGADPDAVVARLAEEPNVVMIAGNHDLAATERFDIATFNTLAAAAIRWTTEVLSADARAVLDALSPRGEGSGALLVHGSVLDPAAEYVATVAAAQDSFSAEEFALCFFGHTHMPTVFTRDGGGSVRGSVLPDGEPFEITGRERLMLNPGSVGQPRDGDPRASFLLYDTAAGTAMVRRVPYPIERAQAKIRAAGLPPALADRLAEGR